VIYDGMPYNSIQGQDHGGLKCAKWLLSNAVSSANMHVIKRLMVSYNTPRQFPNFNQTDV